MHQSVHAVEANSDLFGGGPIEDILLREMTHRVNNEYAIAVNTVTLRAMRSDNREVQAALHDVVELLMRFADVHRALAPPIKVQSLEACKYIRELCQAICSARLVEQNIAFSFSEEEPQYLPADRCWRLGLAVSELISNASKHAFSPGGGEIRVELATDGVYLRCCVRDNGDRRVVAEPGNGLRLINSLVESTGGAFDYAFEERGAISVITMPCPEERSDNAPRVASENG